MTTIPPLRQSGSSANITWYTADGWHVEVLCTFIGKRGGQVVEVPPKFHFRVSRLDVDRRRVGDEQRFTYEPKTKPRSGWTLPDRTVTRQVRQHLAATDQNPGQNPGGAR